MKLMSSLLLVLTAMSTHQVKAQEFKTLNEFGANPGELSAKYIPATSSSNALFVLLHGCGQSAVELANQSGLSDLSKTKGFALLAVQQHASNNATTCFNWFSEADQLSGQGEALSIMNMINKTKQLNHSKEVYLIGLSAGGAMASNLLTQHPKEFAAGAVIAGIPYPCANNLIKAISCMKSGASNSAKQMAQELSSSTNDWPDLVIITGDKDQIVAPINSEQMAKQWRLMSAANQESKRHADGYSLQNWQGENNSVELITINNLGHGLPINATKNSTETPAPFVLDSAFSTAEYLVYSWLK